MPRKSDPVHRELWKDRLQRYSESALSVAEFCRQEAVCASTFYQWRNKLAATTGVDRRRANPPKFLPVQLAGAALMAPTIKLPGGAIIELPASLRREQLTEWLTACIQATDTTAPIKVS